MGQLREQAVTDLIRFSSKVGSSVNLHGRCHSLHEPVQSLYERSHQQVADPQASIQILAASALRRGDGELALGV